MAVYGYGRVSTQVQSEDGESLGVQERQINGWAMMQGHQVAEMFIDRAVSGSVPLGKRPEGARLMKALKRGDIIVTSRLDRLFRSSLDALQTCEDAQKRGIEIHVIEGLGNITTNGMGKAFMTIAATFAELERDTIRERISSVKADQKSRNRYLGGAAPFGWQPNELSGELEPHPTEQRIISRAAQLRHTPGVGPRTLRNIQAEIADEFDGRIVSLATLAKIVKETA